MTEDSSDVTKLTFFLGQTHQCKNKQAPTHAQIVTQTCGSEFLEKTTPVSLQGTELISSELYPLGNINLHKAEESTMTNNNEYKRR